MINDIKDFFEQYSQLLEFESRINRIRSRTIKLRRKMEKEYFKHYTYDDRFDLIRKTAIYLCWKEEKEKNN